MFDSKGAFRKQFTPYQDGYVVYTSKAEGGKFISKDEHDQLLAGWDRVSGRAGVWKAVGVITVALLLWTLLAQALAPPEWIENAVIGIVVVAISVRLVWASFAPRRLVKGRSPVTPPRPVSAARRDARAALNWPFVIFALLLSGSAFFGTINKAERTPSVWAWLIGSGLMLAAYLWIAFRKLFDPPR